MADKLENKVLCLFPEVDEVMTAHDLYARGYEPKHRTMRKIVDGLEVCYKQTHGGLFEFGGIIRVETE